MPLRNPIREPFNAFSHLVGAVLIPLGTAYLLLKAHTTPEFIAFAIFGLSATFLFASSTLYHWGPEDKPWLQRLDHCAIYVMIAGTYTPISIFGLPSPANWLVLTLQWTLALIGVTVTITRDKTPTWLRLTLYLAMGWMIIAFITPFKNNSSTQALTWLFAGGIAYTLGSVIYSTKKPTLWPGKFSSHELWHLFVLAGATCHFIVMLNL